MTRIVTFDAATAAKLGSFKERIEVCDETGRPLGHFTPLGVKSVYEGLNSPFSDEELDRRQREGGGRTLAEVLADLERLQ